MQRVLVEFSRTFLGNALRTASGILLAMRLKKLAHGEADELRSYCNIVQQLFNSCSRSIGSA